MKRLTGRGLEPSDISEIIHSKEIEIDGGYTIEEDMKILATALTDKSCKLERLQLHYFSLQVKEFTEALKSKTCTLKTLHLYENKLTADHAKELATALQENRSIDTLILNECEIDCAAARELAVALEGNETLRIFNLWDNNIGDEGGKALAEALTKNTALRTLNLWGNQIGNVGAEAFADSLRENNSLRDLIFVYNKIGDDGGDELVNALEENEGIRNLDLFGNPVDQSIITDIYCMINSPNRSYYEGGLNMDERGSGVKTLESSTIDTSCFSILGRVHTADGESTASPTGVIELSGCC
jgi:Ran GTPase-activating protein (RanGAP) involved in mRNA processing and transport